MSNECEQKMTMGNLHKILADVAKDLNKSQGVTIKGVSFGWRQISRIGSPSINELQQVIIETATEIL